MTQEDAREKAAALAEQVCFLWGWGPADPWATSDRGRALYVAWRDWCAAYEAAGGSLSPRDHPELSDDAIHDLALRRWEGVGPY